jgi:hypothetical protein
MTKKAKKNVLVAAEYSGVVRDAFLEKGHRVISCDLLPTQRPGPHYQGDVREIIDAVAWDLLIAHPPCTYLAVSGMHWTTRGFRDPQLTEDALDFVRLLMNSKIKEKAIENPVSIISTRIRKYDQLIHPYMFGHDASKSTCLWLDNLQPLDIDPSQYVEPRWVCCGSVIPEGRSGFCKKCNGSKKPLPRWGNQTNSGQNALSPSDDRWKKRSDTFPGIAKAMAEKWG